jgi:hypothetical protein
MRVFDVKGDKYSFFPISGSFARSTFTELHISVGLNGLNNTETKGPVGKTAGPFFLNDKRCSKSTKIAFGTATELAVLAI